MNRKLTIGLVAVLSLVLVAALGDGTPPVEAKKPKTESGKALYKAYCKACHAPGSEHGEYQPLTLIQDQWERFFTKRLTKTHGELDAPDGSGTKLLELLDAEQIEAIYRFAYDHAADSESPMTCG